MKTTSTKIPRKQLIEFCRRNHIRRMALFGSVLRDDFRVDSDIDILVLFEPDARVGFLAIGHMKRELSTLFQRSVDLVPEDGLKPVIRDSILESSVEIYAS